MSGLLVRIVEVLIILGVLWGKKIISFNQPVTILKIEPIKFYGYKHI